MNDTCHSSTCNLIFQASQKLRRASKSHQLLAWHGKLVQKLMLVPVYTFVWNKLVKECTLFNQPRDKLIEYLHEIDYNIINLNISIGLYSFMKMSDLDDSTSQVSISCFIIHLLDGTIEKSRFSI